MSNINATTSQDYVAAGLKSPRTHQPPTLAQLALPGLMLVPSASRTPISRPVTDIHPCPYHETILRLVSFPGNNAKGHVGIDRYLKEESEQQGPLFWRPDNSLASLHKDCTCGEDPKKNAPKL